MKTYFQILALLPCSILLTSPSLSEGRIAEVYSKILFETSYQRLSLHDLNEMRNRAIKDPEELFRLPEGGESELEPIREGLKSLRNFAGNELKNLGPKLLELLDQRIELTERNIQLLNQTVQARTQSIQTPFTTDGESYVLRHATNHSPELFVISSKFSAAGSGIHVWDSASKQLLFTLPTKRRYSEIIRYGNPDRIALTYTDNNTKGWRFGVFDIKTNKFIRELDVEDAAAYYRSPWHSAGLWVSPDGRFIMGRNFATNQITVWDSLENRSVPLKDQSVRTILTTISAANNGGEWRIARFLPNGTIVTIDPTHLHHWNPMTGALLKTIELPPTSQQQARMSPNAGSEVPGEISRDGRYWLAAAHDRFNVPSFRGWSLIDLETGKTVSELRGNSKLLKIRLSPDNKSVIEVTEHSLSVYDIASKKTRFTIPHIVPAGTQSMAFSPDSAYLAFEDNQNGTTIITIWDVENNSHVLDVGSKTETVSKPTFNSDGSRLITQGNDNTVRIWSLDFLGDSRK